MSTDNLLFDSYIFDMDGTLWDAVDSYCAVWNRTIDELRPGTPHIKRPELEKLMGKPLSVIYDTIVGTACDPEEFSPVLRRNEQEMMPQIGGKLYPGVKETLAGLKARGARLFMVSNCGPKGLPNFLTFTKLEELMTDTLSYGTTGHDKDVNIRALVERYNLKRPVYVGDIQGDCDATHAAGVPFIWATYGFGHNVQGADYTIHDFPQLLDLK